MTDISNRGTQTDVIQRYARAAGVAMLLSTVFGFLGEAYIPERIIADGDATATLANLAAHPTLFRLGFAAYLVEGFCDIILCVLWYVILKPVNRNLALVSAFVGVVSMVTFAIAQAGYFSSSLIVKDAAGMSSFAAEQRDALAFLAMRIATMIATLFIGFYGLASMIRGYLIARSGYLPKILGMLLVIGGAGFFLRGITYVLVPKYSSIWMLIPMAIAGIPLMLWLLVKGVNRQRLEATS